MMRALSFGRFSTTLSLVSLVALGGCFDWEALSKCSKDNPNRVAADCDPPVADGGMTGTDAGTTGDMATAQQMDMASTLPTYESGVTQCPTYAVAQAIDKLTGMAKKFVCLPKPVRTATGAPQSGQSVSYATLVAGSLLGKSINGANGGTWVIAPTIKSLYIVATGIGATPLDLNEFGVTQAPFGTPVRTTPNFGDGQVIEPTGSTKLIRTAGSAGAVLYGMITYDPANDSIVATLPLPKGVDTDGTTPVPDTGVVR